MGVESGVGSLAVTRVLEDRQAGVDHIGE